MEEKTTYTIEELIAAAIHAAFEKAAQETQATPAQIEQLAQLKADLLAYWRSMLM